MESGKLESYLIQITHDILAYRDADGQAMVDLILDAPGRKARANGRLSRRWIGAPLTLIGEAVFARVLSSLVNERLAAKLLRARRFAAA